jgi:hypothetical protein
LIFPTACVSFANRPIDVVGGLERNIMLTNEERIAELEHKVKKIENYLSRVGIPSGDLIESKLKSLGNRVDKLETDK